MTQETFIEFAKTIANSISDEDTMKKLKEIADDYGGRAEVSKEDVYDKDGIKWSEKYDDSKRRYLERFFTSPAQIAEDTKSDVEKDSKPVTFSDLFTARVGDYN